MEKEFKIEGWIIRIVLCRNLKEMHKEMITFGCDAKLNLLDSIAFCETIPKKMPSSFHGAIVFFNKKHCTLPVIVHESVHVASALFYRTGIKKLKLTDKYADENEEGFAELTAIITNKIYKLLTTPIKE